MNYHILEKSADNRYVTIAVHLPIPSSQNVAGVALSDATLTYQRAMKEKLERDDKQQGGDGTITSQVPDIGAELTSLQSGALFEKVFQFRFDSTDLTNAQRKTQIEGGNVNERGITQMMADISDSTSDLYQEIIAPLVWWGYKADV